MDFYLKITISEPTATEMIDVMSKATNGKILPFIPLDGQVIPINVDKALHSYGFTPATMMDYARMMIKIFRQ